MTHDIVNPLIQRELYGKRWGPQLDVYTRTRHNLNLGCPADCPDDWPSGLTVARINDIVPAVEDLENGTVPTTLTLPNLYPHGMDIYAGWVATAMTTPLLSPARSSPFEKLQIYIATTKIYVS